MNSTLAVWAWAAPASGAVCVLLALAAANRAVLAGTPPAARVSIPLALITAFGALIVIATRPGAFEAVSSIALLSALSYFAAFDLRFSVVPVWPLVACTLAGIAAGWLISADVALERAAAAAGGGASLLGLDRLYRRIRGRSGLGEGDALAAALIGAWLSWPGLIWSIALGASVGVGWMLASGRAQSPAPFVPALAAGTALFLLTGGLR